MAKGGQFSRILHLSGEEELTRTFYNNYDWVNGYSTGLSNTYSAAYDGYFDPVSNSNWPYAQANVQTNQLKGVVTGSRVKVLGTANTYLYTVNFYNEKGRVIQTQATNIAGTVDITTTQYTWAGQPLVIVQKTDLPGADVEDLPFIIKTKMDYDDLGRVLTIWKTIYGTFHMQPIDKAAQTIVQNEYDALGQLKKKTLGANNLENLTYDYNIRGWMLGANRLYAKDAATNYFGFDLGYDKANNSIVGNQTYSNPQFNGNIEGMVWKSKGDGEKRKYDFEYDNANRLWKGNFTQYTGAVFNETAGVNYNVKMGDGTDVTTAYDANGNIKRMQQWGWKLTGSIPIDDLNYEYLPNSNKLAKVTDMVPADNKLGDFKNGTNTGNDYDYDVNGNLNLDNNKTISAITYNHLSLPAVITVTGKGTISYTYDAAGNKIKKETQESPNTTNGNKTITTTITYRGGMVYESKTTLPTNTPDDDYTDRLQFIGHEEGRIRFKPAVDNIAASLQYDYMLKDHLGNVRMVLTEEVQHDRYPAVTLENDTYNGGTAISVEEKFYNIDNSKIIVQTSIPGFIALPAHSNHNGVTNNNPYSNTGIDSKRVYLLNASGNTVQDKNGLGIVLKVMAGDVINVWGKSYHKKTGGADYTLSTNPLSVVDLMNLLANSPVASQKGISGTQISQLPLFPTNVTSLLNNQPPQNADRPRASINWVILDEQFKYVSGGFDMVETANATDWAAKNHTIPNIAIPKNGYIYVYCSNESQYNVFFDNLQVVHERGPILEETHYYPFGLPMVGISSKSAGKLENKKKFNGIEYNTDFDINSYDAFYRTLDPQIGRFWQIDPKLESAETWSPYAAMLDNPIRYADPLGDSVGVEDNSYFDKKTGTYVQQIDITVTGKVVNESSTAYTPEQMQAIVDRIRQSIISTYSDVSENSTTTVTTDISVASGTNPEAKSDHLFILRDDGNLPDSNTPGGFRQSGVVGHASAGEKGVYLATTIVGNFPATTGQYAGTGLNSAGDATLERTSAHELGHTLYQDGGYGSLDLHPTDNTKPGNLMNQSSKPDAGMKLTPEQRQQIINDFNAGKLNGGRQRY